MEIFRIGRNDEINVIKHNQNLASCTKTKKAFCSERKAKTLDRGHCFETGCETMFRLHGNR